MKTIEFGVKCSNFNLMKAFKEECESMGWYYQRDFREFTEYIHGQHHAMYFTDDWNKKPFGFALTNLGRDVVTVFNLPLDWDAAVKHARTAIDSITKLQLNDAYQAEINFGNETVKVGCQSFSFDKINELAELINKQ